MKKPQNLYKEKAVVGVKDLPYSSESMKNYTLYNIPGTDFVLEKLPTIGENVPLRIHKVGERGYTECDKAQTEEVIKTFYLDIVSECGNDVALERFPWIKRFLKIEKVEWEPIED